jgi:hypothetical protein
MILLKYKTRMLWLLFVMVILNTLPAFSYPLAHGENKPEFKKNISKEFNISANGKVGLTNQYGRIDVKTWDQNKVKIDVTITVVARTEGDAEKIFDRIKIEFANGADLVEALTVFDKQNKDWWNENTKAEFKIDYLVQMPKSCNLDLSNKYGHVYIAEIDGAADIEVNYGDLTMDGVNNDCKISLGYGNGTIVKTKNADINIKYSHIKINKAAGVKVNSRYSQVYIDEATDVSSASKYDSYRLGNLSELKNIGKYDNFEIRDIDMLSADSQFSDFEVENLKSIGSFSMTYGNLAIKNLRKNFKSLQLNGKYTDFKITPEQGADYVIDIEANFADVKYPGDLAVTFKEKKNTSHKVKGYVGSKNAGLIQATLEFGGIVIK